MKSIEKYKNILSQDLIVKVDSRIEKLINDKTTLFTASTTMWGKELLGSSTPILRYVLNFNEKDLYEELKIEIEKKIPYYVQSIMIYLWPNLGYITWHNDATYKAGLTIYLNKFWDKNWGGIFLYEENDEIKGIVPERNLGILQIGGVNHSTTTINYGSDFRLTLQIFFKKEKSIL